MTKSAEFVFLSQEDVIEMGALDFEASIRDVIRAYGLLDRGEAMNPVGPSLHFGDGSDERFISLHMGWIGSELNVAGAKVVARSPRNPFERGLPSIVALIALIDPETGLPLAVLDGTIITAVRTGASTAAGAKYLARPDSEVMAVVGAGVMAKSQVLALHTVLPSLQEVRVFDVVSEKAEAFAQEVLRRTGLRARAVGSAKEAITEADVVAPATTVSLASAYIRAEWIKPGAFLANVSDNDYTFEAVLKADKIVVDGPKQFTAPVTMGEMKRRGLLDGRRIVTMGQIINGAEAGRTRRDEICFFSAMGLGVHDVICARRILENARATNKGQRLRLWESPFWF